MSGIFFLEVVVPAAGAIISTLMYAAPLKHIIKASLNKSLGDLNAIPFAVTVANTIIWLTYGLLKKDPFITAPNALGVVMSVFTTITAFGLADEQARERVRQIVCLEAVILPLLGVVTAFAYRQPSEALFLWGLAGNVISMVYYSAPLSTMAEVIRTRNSSSILLPLTLMNLTNAILWTTYGLAVLDPYVWLPNGIGTALSLAQLALAMLYPARPNPAGGADWAHNASPDQVGDIEEQIPLKA